MANEINLLVVTPEKTLLDCHVDAVTVPLFDGQKGILPKHAATIGRLGAGVLKATGSDNPGSLFIDGGFVQIDDNVVSVLTNLAVPVGELNQQDLSDKLAKLKSQSPSSTEERMSHQRQLDQTKAMLAAAS